MAHTEYGSVSGGILNKTTRSFTAGVFTITKELTYDSGASTPSLGGTISYESKTYKLINVDEETLPGDLKKVVLTYTAQGVEEEDLPPTSYSESGTTMEVDIRQHPDFDDWADDWDSEKEAFKPGTTKYGVTSYLVGTTQTTVTNYYNSKPSSDKGNLGTRQAPGGDGGSSANNLLIASNRFYSGGVWTKENTYLYSAVPWNTDIYS